MQSQNLVGTVSNVFKKYFKFEENHPPLFMQFFIISY